MLNGSMLDVLFLHIFDFYFVFDDRFLLNCFTDWLKINTEN